MASATDVIDNQIGLLEQEKNDLLSRLAEVDIRLSTLRDLRKSFIGQTAPTLAKPTVSLFRNVPNVNGKPSPTQGIRDLLAANPGGLLGQQIVDALDGRVATQSPLPRQVIRQCLVQLKGVKNGVEEDENGLFRLVK